MKSLLVISLYTVSFLFFFVEEIRPQCNETNCLGYYQENNSGSVIQHWHNSGGIGNCIGFAIASTQQSYIGPICGQAKEISIDEAYAKNYWLTWGFYTLVGDFSPNNLGQIHNNDIL